MPIVLTEAFGCNRCQQIFVVEKSEYVIEQLSTTYPYKKAWLWTGSRWHQATGWKEYYLPIAFLCGVVFPGIWLVWVLNFHTGSHNFFLVIVPVVLLEVVALINWLAYRRSLNYDR